jgi:toxin-antitoxin system PIN domain toxin
MKVVDANVLLNAANERAGGHGTAKAWLSSALDGAEAIGFSWVVLLAFLRLSTHRSAFPRPLGVREATALLDRWLAEPSAHILLPTERHLMILRDLVEVAGTAGNLVNDAYLAALAIEHDGEVVSFDTDFARFPGLRWQRLG